MRFSNFFLIVGLIAAAIPSAAAADSPCGSPFENGSFLKWLTCEMAYLFDWTLPSDTTPPSNGTLPSTGVLPSTGTLSSTGTLPPIVTLSLNGTTVANRTSASIPLATATYSSSTFLTATYPASTYLASSYPTSSYSASPYTASSYSASLYSSTSPYSTSSYSASSYSIPSSSASTYATSTFATSAYSTSIYSTSTYSPSTLMTPTLSGEVPTHPHPTAIFEFLGVNESGAEFGNTAIPGELGKDYTWPNTSAIEVLMKHGLSIFRIPILMERLAPGTMTSAFNETYLEGLKSTVSWITGAEGHAVVDSHNFGRYGGAIITSTSDFQTYWENLATEFKNDSNVVFDCNNEFHDEPSNSLVVSLNQACIDGIRAAGATTQYIFVEGTSYTGAWTWNTTSGNAASMGSLTDPSDKIIYEMHQYLDSDGSGTSDTCVSSTIGAERIADATAWLKANNKKGILGEFAAGANPTCYSAVTGMLDAMIEANDVWIGAMWWGGGPWWGNYIFSMEPESGTGFQYYFDTLTEYI